MKREQILDEALGLLLQRGLKRFSLSELAERLGVVRSAFYFHFPGGKKELVEAVFSREEERVLQAMEEAMAGAATCKDKLRALVAAKLDSVFNLVRLFGVSATVGGELASYCRRSRNQFLQRERELLERVLAEGMAAGEVRELNLTLLVAGLQAGLFEVTEKVALAQEVDPRPLSELLVDVLFSGIGRGGGV
ncbi:MAG: TetR/AcrR family transcriptional regulator [Thermoanaerobaculum sp.]|nr:TetR/AcrR family transcriptional regulator [Thermoanaerobaculum sp.]